MLADSKAIGLFHDRRNLPASARVPCPICKAAVYSPAGIHPQCAMGQGDLPHHKRSMADESRRVHSTHQLRGRKSTNTV